MLRLLPFLLLFCCLELSGQTSGPLKTFEEHNPRDFFDAAAPTYNFEDSSLKPWHLKATYEIYDQNSIPSGQGTYEYWWASPKVYRNSWTKPGVSHNDWHMADGKHAYRGDGVLDYFEYALQSALVSPLPGPAELDPSKFRLDRDSVKIGTAKFPCVMVIPLMPQHGRIQEVPLGLFPTYCFTPGAPILRIEYSWGSLVTAFDKIAKVQGHYLAREISIFEGKRKILTATVDEINGIPPNDPALTPPPDVTSSAADEKVQLVAGITTGMLVKKQVPIYPQDAKDAHVSGKVVLRATIGRDGAVHELHTVDAPWPSLVASALWAVSHWQYKPYLVNGEPVEVETTVTVIFSLGT